VSLGSTGFATRRPRLVAAGNDMTQLIGLADGALNGNLSGMSPITKASGNQTVVWPASPHVPSLRSWWPLVSDFANEET
jgi:hypothetical protein